MKINKNSWHYALVVGKNTDTAPKTLCGYFWRLVGALFLTVFMFVFFALFFFGGPVAFAFSYKKDSSAWVFLLPWIVVGSVFATFFIADFFKKRKQSVLIQYLLSVKGKYCPLIEYVKDDNG